MSTTAEYRYRIVNVFAQDRLDGNPLAVFEDGRGQDDATKSCQQLASPVIRIADDGLDFLRGVSRHGNPVLAATQQPTPDIL